MARSRKKKLQPSTTPTPQPKPSPPPTNGIMAFHNLLEQRYFIDEVPSDTGALFYALRKGAVLTDADADVKLDGLVLSNCGSEVIDAQYLIGLHVDPTSPASSSLRVEICSKELLITTPAISELLLNLEVTDLHRRYNLTYARQVWQDLSGIMAINRAPMVFVVVGVPAFNPGEPPKLDIRIWAPYQPHRLSLAYGLEMIKQALAA